MIRIMANDAGKKRLIVLAVVLAALALPGALVVFGGLKMWQEHGTQTPEPGLSAELRAAAERAADAAMPAPTLGADAVIVECAPRDIEAQVQRVVRLAGGVGGTAAAWNDGSSVRIVAKVPSASEGLFCDMVAKGVYDIAVSGDGHPSAVVEVLVRASNAGSPSKPGR